MLRKVTGWLARATLIASCVLTVPSAQTVLAADYPYRPVRFIVPYAPGGGTDTMARLIQPKLAELWNQAIIVENRPGGGGIVGNDVVAKAPPDGYTILIGITQLIQAPAMGVKLPYDVFKDLVPVTQCALQPNFLVVPGSSAIASLADFIAISKANPGRYSYGSYGTGTTSHLYGELLKKVAAVELVHIPYKGAAPLLSDVLAAHVHSAIIDPLTAGAQIKSGRIKALAVSGPSRSKLLPEVPTFSELGYAGFEPVGWIAAFVPTGTPKGIVDKISRDITKVLRLPDVVERIYDLGSEPAGNTPEEFVAILKADYEKWSKIANDGQIRLY